MLGGWQSSRAAAAAVTAVAAAPLLARPGHQLPPATEERAQQFGACPNLGIISPTQKLDFAGAGARQLERDRDRHKGAIRTKLLIDAPQVLDKSQIT